VLVFLVTTESAVFVGTRKSLVSLAFPHFSNITAFLIAFGLCRRSKPSSFMQADRTSSWSTFPPIRMNLRTCVHIIATEYSYQWTTKSIRPLYMWIHIEVNLRQLPYLAHIIQHLTVAEQVRDGVHHYFSVWRTWCTKAWSFSGGL